MKASIARKIVLFSGAILLVFLLSMLLVTYTMNNKSAKDNADNLLGVFESQIIDGGYTTEEDFNKLVHISDTQQIRVTVINPDSGLIIADSAQEQVSRESHLDRPEIQKALDGGIGSDIRKSETTGVKYLYSAKLVVADNTAVILRICVPVNSINSYIYGIIITMVIVFTAIIAIAVILSRLMAKTFLTPFGLIKNRLDEVLAPDKNSKTIALTKYDDINSILLEIDDISAKLNVALVGYQSEKHKLGLILENINQGIIAIDSEKRIVSCNKTAGDYFCFEYTELMPIDKVIRNKALLDNINQSIAKNEFISYDHTRINGQIFEIRFFPVKYKEISLIISAQNVTDVRKVSLEKQEFFANAGHELKTPLSSILGYSEMLLNTGKYNRVFAETINKEAVRMKELISDMLKISELEQNAAITDESIDLREIVNEVILSYAPKTESKNISLTGRLEPCRIFANREKITEVAANLIDNAIKYTDNGGHIEVSLTPEADKVIFSVQDNGIGIPPQYLNRIFERFFRVDKGRSRQEGGTGLGLAIVKHICNHYNASVSVNSKENEGTKLTIAFPQQIKLP